MRLLLFIGGLSLALTGCPDTAPSTSSNGGGEAGTMGSDDMGGMAGMTTSGVENNESCLTDDDCPNSSYCDFGDGFTGSCIEGCREDGSSCEGGQVCDVDTRECIYPPCNNDQGCPDGTYCNSDSVCESGCRLDEACPEEFDDDGRAIVCDPDTRECITYSPCCVSGDAGDECVAATENQCDALGGQLLTNALLCDSDPCGQTCEVDVDCVNLDINGATYYCDPVDQRCNEGCREGGCEGDLVCDLERRVCIEQSCITADECNEGQYCDPINLVCVTGCGQDSDCDPGFNCSDNQCVERCDPMGDECGEDRYCDAQTQICRDNCASHDACAEAEACDPSTNQCVLGLCRDDEVLGELTGEPNSTFEEATLLNLIPLANEPEKSVGRAEGRVVCGGDVDYYRLRLGQGARMRITLSHEAAGNLNLHVFSEDELVNSVISSNEAQSPEVIEYPGEGEIREDQDYFIEVSGELADDDRVGYDLVVQTAPVGDACFSDSREVDGGDNDLESATSLISNGVSRYDDGSVCLGDEDWFSIPLTVNDGLVVEVRTAIEAQLLRFDLYAQNTLGGIGGNSDPAFSVTSEESVEDMGLGQRIYQLNIPFNSTSFSDDLWFIVVKGDSADNYAAYQLEVTHEAAADVCVNDDHEPNNGVGEGTDLITTFDLPTDNDGFLAQGQDNRILDGVICSGDADYYCFDTAEGDILEAWAVSDNVIGRLAVRLVDSEGGVVGVETQHTLGGEDPDIASIMGTPAGSYCVVVDGLGNAQGPYELNIRRRVIEGGACGVDEEEGRNDTAGTASLLDDISEGQGVRFEKRNGLMCDAANDAADWYSFPVATASSRICAMLEGFTHADADLALELYEPPNLMTAACLQDADCEAMNATACIDGHCQVETSKSTFDFDFEMLGQSRLLSEEGTHYLRVSREAPGAIMPYDLRVTVTPGRDVCQEDWQEFGDLNDSAGFNVNDNSRATVLGSGSVGLCDAWICNRGEGNVDEDWYRITVPAQQDRTVIITFDSQADGPLEMYYWGETETSMMASALMVSSLSNFNYQCINIQGGSVDVDAEIGVASLSQFIDDGDQRIDYSLRVVPTDLELNANGACHLFAPPTIEACDENFSEIIAEDCWPQVNLP